MGPMVTSRCPAGVCRVVRLPSKQSPRLRIVGLKQYPHGWRLRPLWMTRRSCRLLTITYPRVSNTTNCCQRLQGSFTSSCLQPSWKSRTCTRLMPLAAYGGSHDYAWTSNLNAAQANVNETLPAHSGLHSSTTPSAMQSAMRMVAGRQAPAVLSTDAKREVRQEAMSFILAGIVASLVLTTFKDGKSKQRSSLDGSQVGDSTVSASTQDLSRAGESATPDGTSKLASSSARSRATPSSPAQESAEASSSPALPSASSSSGRTAAITSSSPSGSDGNRAASSSSSSAAAMKTGPSEAASGSPISTRPRASAGSGGQMEGIPAESGRAGPGSTTSQSSVSQAASEAAASRSSVSQAASEVAAEGPILKTQQHRKPAIWAAATVTGRPRNSPSPSPKPKDPVSPAAPFKSSSATQSEAQNEAQSEGGRPTQSPLQRVEYITRPQIDPLGRPTGGIEVVPASMVPTGTAPFGLTPVGITPSPPKSSSATQTNAAQVSARGKSEGAESSSTKSEGVQRVEYVTRPQIDPLGRPTGAVEVVPASMVPTGTAPYGITPVGMTPSSPKSSSADKSTAQSKGRDAASSPAQAEVTRVEYVGQPQLDPLGHPTGQVKLVPASVLPNGTTSGGTTPTGTNPVTSVPSEAAPAGTTPAGTTPAGTTPSSGDAVSGNVVSVSEALSKAAEKAGDMSSQTGASRNQPRASSSKPGATPKQAGAGVGSSDDQRGRQSKRERSISWKTRLAGGLLPTPGMAYYDVLSPSFQNNTAILQGQAVAAAAGGGDVGSGSGGTGGGGSGGGGRGVGGGGNSNSGGGSEGGDGGSGGGSGSAVSLLVLMLGLTATGLILLRFELDLMPKKRRRPGYEAMPSAMRLAARQAGNPNLRHSAQSYNARSPIFLTQATEAEKATIEGQQRKWRMKKRLDDMLQPPHAVLSHALSPAKLNRSLNQARSCGNVKGRSNEQVARAATEESLAVALSQLLQQRTEAQALQVEVAKLRADLLALRQFHLRSRAISIAGSDASSWGSDEEEQQSMTESYRPSRRSRSERPIRSSVTSHLLVEPTHHITWGDEPKQASDESSATATAESHFGIQSAQPGAVGAAVQTQDSEFATQLAEAQSQIDKLQRQLEGGKTQSHNFQLAAELVDARTQIAALQSELAESNKVHHAMHAEQSSAGSASMDAATRLRDESGPVSRSASPGREQGELWRQVNSLQSQLQQVQSDRDHMASALLRLAEVPHDTDAAIAKLELQRHVPEQTRQQQSSVTGHATTEPAVGAEGRSRQLPQAQEAELAAAQARAEAGAQQLSALKEQLAQQQTQHAEQQLALAEGLKAAQRAQQEQQAQHRAALQAAEMQHKAQVASLTSSATQQSVEIASLQNSVSSAYSEVQASHDSLAAAVADHDTLVASLKVQHAESESEQAQELSLLQQRLRTVQTDYAAEVAALQEALVAAQSQSQHARDEVVASLQNQLKAQRAQHHASSQRLTELESQQQHHEGVIASLESQLAAERAQYSSGLSAAAESRASDSQQHEVAAAALHAELQQLQQRHAAEVARMDAQFRAQADEFQTDSESRLNSLRAEHEGELLESAQQHQQEVATIAEELKAQHAQHAASTSELDSRLRAEAESHQQEVQSMQQQLTESQQAHAAAVATLSEIQMTSAQQAQHLRGKIDHLKQQTAAAEVQHVSRVATLEKELEARSLSVASLQREVATAVALREQAVAGLEQQLATAVEGLSSDQAQQRLRHQEEMSSLRAELQDAVSTAEAQRAQQAAHTRELETGSAHQQNQLESVQAEFESLSSQHAQQEHEWSQQAASYKQQVSSLNEQLDTYRAQHSTARSELTQLQQQHADVYSQLRLLQTQHESTVTNLQAATSARESELASMTDQHKQRQAEFESLKAQHAQQEAEISSSVSSLQQRLSAEQHEHATALAKLTQQVHDSQQRYALELRSVRQELAESTTQLRQSEATRAESSAAQEGLHQDALSDAKQQLRLSEQQRTSEVATLKETLTRIEQEHSSQVATLRASLAHAEQGPSNDEEVQRLQASLKAMEGRLEAMQDQRNRLLTAIESLAGAGEDVEAVMARLAAQGVENAALKERQSKLDKDQQRSEERLSNARAQRNRLLAAFEGIHAAEDDMEAVIARLESQAAENVALKHRAEGYRNEAGALESRLALIKAQRNKLLAAFEGFAGAGEDVEGVLTRLQAQASENALLRERQAKASSDLQALEERLRLVRAQRNKLLSAFENLQGSGEDVEAVAEKLESQTAATQAMREQLEAQSAELAAARASKNELASEVATLRAEKESARHALSRQQSVESSGSGVGSALGSGIKRATGSGRLARGIDSPRASGDFKLGAVRSTAPTKPSSRH